MQKLTGIFFVLLLLTAGANGQQTDIKGRDTASRPDQQALARLLTYQDTLTALGDTIMNGAFSPERIEANYRFVKTLVDALQVPGSYHFGFDSVTNMRILYAADNSFRIMSWYVDRGNATHRFYGAIQMNQPELKLFGLVDHSSEFANPEDTVSSYQAWYGAYYYEIIPVEAGPRKHHVLLGWSGAGPKISRRVIDVLHFENGRPVFGMPVFQTPEGIKTRIVFRYSSRASMMLDYLPEKRTIVFDHLVPLAEEHRGNYEFYGPDLSYDGFALQNGQWKLAEDLELQNERNSSDKLFNDPERMRNMPASKLPEDN